MRIVGEWWLFPDGVTELAAMHSVAATAAFDGNGDRESRAGAHGYNPGAAPRRMAAHLFAWCGRPEDDRNITDRKTSRRARPADTAPPRHFSVW
jgi:hypothetical protein